ncbi:Hypothetical predicted protein [Pelobates cultripes]|uniref:Plasmalemma vesicle associated protein n=1 Tax=Pelobates cultripes TaxID=61616 RepID=A0AAD1W8W2_PELCU|nr:Hypothetical predicted protein [Pelobates cultripes]
MDKSYVMAKYGLESKEMLTSRNKDCWYYLKYFFLFTSLIQFLIILGLVLFMVYGNAHAFTEARLSDVEKLNSKLLGDLKTQERHIQQMTLNISRLEKERNFYYNMLEFKKREVNTLNSTLALKNAKIIELTTLSSKILQTLPPKCENCKERIDRLNNSCIVEKLIAQNEKDRLMSDLRSQKEDCNKTVGYVRIKMNQAETEKEKFLQQSKVLTNEKTDLIAQMDLFKSSCTTIENKFKIELENLKQSFETSIRLHLPDSLGLNYQQQQLETILRVCRPLPDQISIRIDQALTRLRQDIIATMQENSNLKVSKQRSNEDLKKCGQEKEELSKLKADELDKVQKTSETNLMAANDEKRRLKIEKDEAERNLKDSQDSLSRTSLQLVSCMETVQSCQKNIPSPGINMGIKPNLEVKRQ